MLFCVKLSGHLKPDSSRFSGADQKKVVEDEEYAQMMLRLDELEKAELAAESEDQCDENEHNEADAHYLIQYSGDHVLGSSEVMFMSWLFTRDMNPLP